MYTIEKGIPAPRRSKKNLPIQPKYGVLVAMKKGQSFKLPKKDRNRVAVAAHNYGKQLNRRYTMQTNGSYIRCWRIK